MWSSRRDLHCPHCARIFSSSVSTAAPLTDVFLNSFRRDSTARLCSSNLLYSTSVAPPHSALMPASVTLQLRISKHLFLTQSYIIVLIGMKTKPQCYNYLKSRQWVARIFIQVSSNASSHPIAHNSCKWLKEGRILLENILATLFGLLWFRVYPLTFRVWSSFMKNKQNRWYFFLG